VVYVITLNEPNVYASFSYLSGEWPPQQKSWKMFITVYRNLMKAHRRAYDILKARNSTLQVSVSSQLGNIQAKRPHNLLDVTSTKALRWFWNWWFLNACKKHQDFVGINYYFSDYWKALSFSVADRDRPKQGNEIQVPLLRRINPLTPLNDLGWYMEPEGLYPILMRTWAHYKKPILITENGVADSQDQYRQWWIEQTVVAMERAMSEGVDLKGYMHWSLLDNFEWAFGWWPKFGLLEVDRENGMKRKPRPSAVWFAHFLRDLREGKGGRAVSASGPRSIDNRRTKSPSSEAPAALSRMAPESEH
jgi:beta-glucosidase